MPIFDTLSSATLSTGLIKYHQSLKINRISLVAFFVYFWLNIIMIINFSSVVNITVNTTRMNITLSTYIFLHMQASKQETKIKKRGNH